MGVLVSMIMRVDSMKRLGYIYFLGTPSQTRNHPPSQASIYRLSVRSMGSTQDFRALAYSEFVIRQQNLWLYTESGPISELDI